MSTDLEVHRPSSVMPANEWLLMAKQAEVLAQANIIPSAYRGRPANIMVAAVTGRLWGWDVMTSIRNGNVIEGVWGMKPEAMLGLVRRAGHSVSIEHLADGAKVSGTRTDNGDTMAVTFTFADAVFAGLCTMKDGRPFARSKEGRRLPWEQWPINMCQWRAVGLVCRTLFSDITAGVYLIDELTDGVGTVDAEGVEVIDIGPIDMTPREPLPLSDEFVARFVEACESAGLAPSTVIDAAFEGKRPDPLTEEHVPAMRDAFRRMQGGSGTEFRRDENAGGTEVPDDAPPSSTADPESVRPASRRKIGAIKGEYKRLGIDEPMQYVRTSGIIGRLIASHNDLNDDEASRVLDVLVAEP